MRMINQHRLLLNSLRTYATTIHRPKNKLKTDSKGKIGRIEHTQMEFLIGHCCRESNGGLQLLIWWRKETKF